MLTDAQIVERKKKFAENLLLLVEPFKAALATFPEHEYTGIAMQILTGEGSWVSDPLVLSEKKRLMGTNDAKGFLATKSQQLHDLYIIAQDAKHSPEDRIKAHRLFAEISGFIEKPSATGSINILNQGLMVMRDHGSDDDWEKKAIDQQRTLTANANSTVN